jgi:hypothetical protein
MGEIADPRTKFMAISREEKEESNELTVEEEEETSEEERGREHQESRAEAFHYILSKCWRSAQDSCCKGMKCQYECRREWRRW